MVGIILMLVAGWYRSKLAAAVIVLASVAAQLMVVIPNVNEQRRLLGLPPKDVSGFVVSTSIQFAIVGVLFYVVGYGARWLWERQRAGKRR